MAPSRTLLSPEYLSVYGTLLLHAALAAAASGDKASVGELLAQARTAALGAIRDYHWTSFGPALVAVVEVVAAVELGRGADVVAGLEAMVADKEHQRLPVAVRAAHLVEEARAYLQAGDATAAGRAVVTADRTAVAEVRWRPAVREVLGAVLRQSRRPEQPVVQLAEELGVTV